MVERINIPPACAADFRVMDLDQGRTAFRIRSESETQPNALSTLRSEAS